MANIPISTLYPEVQLFIPGGSEPLIAAAIVATLIDFCDESLIWWEENPAVFVPSGIGSLSIPTPPLANNAAVREVYVDGAPVRGYTTLELKNTMPNWMNLTGYPSGYIVHKNTFRLVPKNDKDVYVSCRVAYKPSRVAVDIEDWLYEDWWEVIKAGALARLMIIPGNTWSNPKQALHWEAVYKAGVRNATVEANKNRSTSSMKVKFSKA